MKYAIGRSVSFVQWVPLTLFLSTAPMAAQNVIIKDTFTGADGTLLQNHDPDTGSARSWQKGSSADLVFQGQRAQNTGLGQFAVYFNNTPLPSADYTISVTGRFGAATSRDTYFQVMGRANGVSDYYFAALSRSFVVLGKYAGGVPAAPLVSKNVTTITPDTDFTLSMAMSGNNISMLLNGVPTLSITDSSYTTPGRVVLAAETIGAPGLTLDDFTVSGPSSGADLDVTLTPAQGHINDDPKWTGTVRNKGPEIAQGVGLKVGMGGNVLMFSTLVESGSQSCPVGSYGGSCDLGLGSLPSGGTLSFTVSLLAKSTTDSGFAKAEAEVSSGTPDPSPADNAARSEIRKVDCGEFLYVCLFEALACEATTR